MSVKHSLLFVCALALFGCDKDKAESDKPEDKKGVNLCKDYSTCNECIEGQIARGNSEGEAETQCGAAVTGCWTTWDKPIVCGEKTHDEKPSE